MLRVRASGDRGYAQMGWLKSRHSFSFGDYHDPEHMGFGPLRVINEDWIAPGAGFPTHPHRDMEIVTLALGGALAHQDSLGNGSVIKPGEVQKMSAGTGIRHSEFNASDSEVAHILQIWVMPEKNGLEPGYEQKTFAESDRQGTWQLIASPDGESGSIVVHQDMKIYLARVKGALDFPIQSGRQAYAQIAEGAAQLNGISLQQGDAAAVQQEPKLSFKGDALVLLFEMKEE